MNNLLAKRSGLHLQRGALLVVTLIILLIVSMLGMASMDSSGLEMRMTSNSRDQQQAFEAAEYTLSRVQHDLVDKFSKLEISSATGCGSTCFDPSCGSGYCFQGQAPQEPANCMLDAPSEAVYRDPTIWEVGSGLHQTLVIPGIDISSRYIIEYRCFTALDPSLAFHHETNYTRMFRITAYAIGPAGRGRAMLRAVINTTAGLSILTNNDASPPQQSPTLPVPNRGGRMSWEILEIPF